MNNPDSEGSKAAERAYSAADLAFEEARRDRDAAERAFEKAWSACIAAERARAEAREERRKSK